LVAFAVQKKSQTKALPAHLQSVVLVWLKLTFLSDFYFITYCSMKIVCPLCGKNLPRFESILIHLNRVHPELTKEKALDLAQGAKITDVSRKGDKKVISTLKREKSVLLGEKYHIKR